MDISSILILVLLTSFIIVNSVSSSSSSSDDSDDSMCCIATKATTKWMTTCPTFSTETDCEYRNFAKNDKKNKCNWRSCSVVGYCEWNGVTTGRSGNIENLCARKTNRKQCVSVVFAGSDLCQWIYGTPPQNKLLLQQYDDNDDEEEEEEEIFMVENQNYNLGRVKKVKGNEIGELYYLLLGFVCVFCIGLTLWRQCKNHIEYGKETTALLSQV